LLVGLCRMVQPFLLFAVRAVIDILDCKRLEGGAIMKLDYEKPELVVYEELQHVTAQPSGPV
jgi:hypothetical protein